MHAPAWARLGVLLSKALRGAADEGALSSRPFFVDPCFAQRDFPTSINFMISNNPPDGRPRETAFSVEEWTKQIEFENHVLRNTLSKVEEGASLRRVVSWLLFAALCAVGYSSCSENRKDVEIMEGDATRLHVTRDHWWHHDEYILEARPNPDEDNKIQWAKKLPNGSYFFVNAESLYQ